MWYPYAESLWGIVMWDLDVKKLIWDLYGKSLCGILLWDSCVGFLCWLFMCGLYVDPYGKNFVSEIFMWDLHVGSNVNALCGILMSFLSGVFMWDRYVGDIYFYLGSVLNGHTNVVAGARAWTTGTRHCIKTNFLSADNYRTNPRMLVWRGCGPGKSWGNLTMLFRQNPMGEHKIMNANIIKQLAMPPTWEFWCCLLNLSKVNLAYNKLICS